MTLTPTSQYLKMIYEKSTFNNKHASMVDRTDDVAKKRKMSSVENRVNDIKNVSRNKKAYVCW
jgi:hypothetical protein